MKDLSELLSVAEEAVEIGRRLIATSGPGQIHVKGDRDLVTDLDLQIQREIKYFLGKATPDVDFLGEELGGGTLDENDDYVWVLDPIDGTSNFSHDIPLCASQLALIRGGEPVVGVIVAPFLGLRYCAVKGGGAFCNGIPIQASVSDDLGRAIVSIGDYATGANAIDKNKRRFAITQTLVEKVERVRMFGSAALDLAWVAEGRIDACFIDSNNSWDTAAGVLLAREAQATVIDFSGSRHEIKSRSTLAISKNLSSQVLSLLGNVVS